MNSGLAYLDSSAFVKLIRDESESLALVQELGAWPRWIASELLEVEVKRVATRVGRGAQEMAAEMLRRTDLVPMSEGIRAKAVLVERQLRTLDAIHLATALVLRDRVGGLFSYDLRLISAAEKLGFRVLKPR